MRETDFFHRDDGTILGAQIVGRNGVDKRIDVIATAIAPGTTAERLADLELAYAPPFSSAKDPVNMLGYMAENAPSWRLRTSSNRASSMRSSPKVGR